MIKTVLFDLDGTLTDPKEGITKSVAYALQKLDISVTDRNALDVFIGPPLQESFMKYYHMSEERANTAIQYYRAYFKRQGMFENVPYEGIKEVLEKLSTLGYQLVVATSKPEIFATEIVQHFHLDSYFLAICGATMDGSRSAKGDVIAYAIQKHQLNAKQCLMVGDRKHDVLGASTNNIPCIGVLYGYGSEEELRQAQAACMVSSVLQLQQAILNWK